jgi:hypothetical protein
MDDGAHSKRASRQTPDLNSHNLYRLNFELMRPFRVTAVGYEDLPGGQLVFIPNHASYIDAFAIAAALSYDRFRATEWAGWTGIAAREGKGREAPERIANALHDRVAALLTRNICVDINANGRVKS